MHYCRIISSNFPPISFAEKGTELCRIESNALPIIANDIVATIQKNLPGKFTGMSQYMHYLWSKQNMWQHLYHDTILTQKLLTESNRIGRLTHWFRTCPKMSNVICSSKWRHRWRMNQSKCICVEFISPFLANIPILYPLKALQNLCFSLVFMGYEMAALAGNALKSYSNV